MRTIQTTAVVTPERTITVQLPPDVPPGVCQVVVVVEQSGEQKPFPYNLPVYDVGPWPEGFTASREQIYDDDGR
ncbi:MAG TPA: hypothetical protein VM533_03775 [Fimbriiglobus sp.]|jgi:hypothetical protein|nr:hypothetical protein [Fimbriiglobus sp.]